MQLRTVVSSALLSVASASPLLGRQYNSSSPCAEVSASAASTLSASPSATPTVGAQLAYDCLNSVPLHKEEALNLFDSISPYVEWQSDIEYLKDPPSGYLLPAVDIRAEFAEIRSNIENESYESEYAFQADLFRRFNLPHDGHFRFFPDLLTGVLRFTRNVGLVSVSMDGSAIPEIYVHYDIASSTSNNATGYPNISPVTTINGEEASKFIEELSLLGALNDPDSLYNSMFFSKPFAAATPGWEGYFSGSARFGFIYPGANTTLGFKNGTEKTYESTSQVIGDFAGVTDGESAYQKFCTGKAPPPEEALSPQQEQAPAPAPGYPIPEIISRDHVVSGYFLNSSEHSDVAVLSMLSFAPQVPAEFQAVIEQFFAQAKAAGKKKLVVDVSANGGGIILNGYDAFRQLFPQTLQDGFTRFRYSDALAVMSEQFAIAIPEDFDPDTADEETISAFESFVNYRYDLNLENKHFQTVREKFPPDTFNNDNFTAIIRWDLDDPLTTVNDTFGLGMEITGYGTRKNFTQPFADEDIIFLTDGYCASTCTIVSEFLRVQTGVKSVAIGGRPNTGPMQHVGGVKGANNAGYDYLYFLAQYAYTSGTPEQQQWANWTALTDLNLDAFYRSTGTSINLRDNILRDDLDEGLPNQFVYNKADCRLFYEPSMVSDVAKMWEAVASAAWGNKACVEGDLGGYKKRNTPSNPQMRLAPRQGQASSMRFAQGTFMAPEKGPFWTERHGEKVPA